MRNTPAIMLLAAALALAGWPAAAHGEGPQLESYPDAAAVEQVYGAAQDAISLDQARQLLFELVNADRAKRRLGLLVPLPAAGALAQQHAAEMARKHYAGHYSLAGLKCEARFNALGETDQVAENIVYYEIDHRIYLTPQLVRRMHQHWMESESHRTNMFDPWHTHFGSGFSLAYAGGRSYVAGVEEFVADYGDVLRLPLTIAPNTTLELSGWLDPARAQLRFIALGSEDLPFRRSVEYQMHHITGYSPPDAAKAFVPVQYKGRWSPRVQYSEYIVQYDAASGEYNVGIEIAKHWPPAAYYVSAWASPPGKREPLFCVMTQVVLVR